MSFDPVPWFVGGGAEHSPDVARLVAHAATSGAAGIISSTDLLCTTTPAPTGFVRIYPGACVIPNTYDGVSQQSYMARAASVTDVPVTATGSAGGRSDMVVVRVDDPQFGGAAPADVATGPYIRAEVIENVGGGAAEVPAWVDFPCIPLARIDLPANTATVTADLIFDLRKVAQPRRSRDLYNTQPTLTTDATSTTVIDWAPQADRTLVVPSWATQMKVIGTVAGCKATGALTGNVTGSFGASALAGNAIDMEANTRGVAIVTDTIAIPASVRGTSQVLKLRANRSGGTGALRTDTYTSVTWDVEFLEVPSAD